MIASLMVRAVICRRYPVRPCLLLMVVVGIVVDTLSRLFATSMALLGHHWGHHLISISRLRVLALATLSARDSPVGKWNLSSFRTCMMLVVVLLLLASFRI